jgi:hypothetical protein
MKECNFVVRSVHPSTCPHHYKLPRMNNETQHGLLVSASPQGGKEGWGRMFCYISHSQVRFIFFRVDFFFILLLHKNLPGFYSCKLRNVIKTKITDLQDVTSCNVVDRSWRFGETFSPGGGRGAARKICLKLKLFEPLKLTALEYSYRIIFFGSIFNF